MATSGPSIKLFPFIHHINNVIIEKGLILMGFIMQSQSCFQENVILSKLCYTHTKITKTTLAFWYPGAICLNGNSDFFFFPSNDKVGHTMSLIFYFLFFHLLLVYHGKKKFQKTIRHTNSIQTKSPQTETLRTFDILHDDSIPFARKIPAKMSLHRVETQNQNQSSPGKYTHTQTQTSMHTQTCITSRHVDPQRVCGDVQMWRICLQATTRIIHTRTLFLYFPCTDYTVNVCVTTLHKYCLMNNSSPHNYSIPY